MQNRKCLILLKLIALSLIVTGCVRNRDDIWEDSKSASRHFGRGLSSLGGKQGESRAIYSPDAMAPCYVVENDFIPLLNDEFPGEIAMNEVRQSRESPGDPGSAIPGLEAFRDPSKDPSLANLFRNIRFPYNSNLIKGQDNFAALSRIAEHLKSNPGEYVFIEGHCDERGSEAYNFALGSKRANAVRTILINEGVDPDRVFTISYGKERPASLGHDDESWGLNRRAEFKVWKR